MTIGNSPIIPKEKTGGVPVNLQDQTTRLIVAKFNNVINSTTLSVAAVKDAKTITVTSTTGFVDGRFIVLFEPVSVNFSFYVQIGAPAGNVITLDTPLDFSYPIGTFVDTAITNLNVDGSSTTQVFGLRGTGAPPGVDLEVDITRIIFNCVASSPVDLTLFADIPALLNGLVLRKRNVNIVNIFNVKTNIDLAGLLFNFEVFAATNPQQGEDGFIARMTFAGQNRMGVVIRLPLGTDLEFLVQDDLSAITLLEVTAEGHIVTD